MLYLTGTDAPAAQRAPRAAHKGGSPSGVATAPKRSAAVIEFRGNMCHVETVRMATCGSITYVVERDRGDPLTGKSVMG